MVKVQSKTIFIYFLILISLIACIKNPKESSSSDGAIMQPGDIVVTSTTADSVLLLDKDGNFKKLLLNLDNNLEIPYGLDWNPFTYEIIVSINGSPDRLMGISALDGTVREVVRNTAFNGNAFGVAVTALGEYLAIESNSIEKFTATGSRINNGTFPKANIMSNLAQIRSLSAGGFVLCANGTDRVRTYNDSATQQNETQSGIAGTTNAYGCAESPDGTIAASWDGTTDTIALYSSDLSTEVMAFADSSYLNAPRGVTVKADGNILAADAGYEWIVEVTPAGEFVRTLGSGLIADPYQVIEIPSY